MPNEPRTDSGDFLREDPPLIPDVVLPDVIRCYRTSAGGRATEISYGGPVRGLPRKVAVDRHQSGVQHRRGARPSRAARHRSAGGPHPNCGVLARAHSLAEGLEARAARAPEEQTHHTFAHRYAMSVLSTDRWVRTS